MTDWKIPSARAEVLRGKYAIERETAIKWAGRAIAAWRLYMEHSVVAWRDLAISYSGEAVEHAAASGDDELLGDIRDAMRRVSRALVD